MVSCNNQYSGSNDNVLLGDETKIWYVAGLDNPNTPADWIIGLDLEKLMELAFKPILNGQINVYSPNQLYFVEKEVPIDKIKRQLGWKKGVTNYNELKELFFHEKWSASANLHSFKKEVEFWGPVQVWNPNGTGEILKRLNFHVRPTSNEKGKIVGKSVFTEFDFENPSSYPFWYGFDPRNYINSVLDNIQNDKLKVYDPVYLVDKSLIKLNSEELEKLIGQDLGSDDLRNNIWSFIFEENWYIHQESLNLYKEVKSIGFVKKYWKKGEQKSKILFFLKFE
jgi:hypothetical protein